MGSEDQLLFTYGTLQYADVQLDTFGRLVAGSEDVLSGYRLEYAHIDDPRVVDLSGRSEHPILRHTGDPLDKVVGRVLEVRSAEIEAADEYEASIYRRASALLDSGRRAWVYVESAPPDGAD